MKENEVEPSEVADMAQALERMKNSKGLIERDVEIMLGRIGVQQAVTVKQGQTTPNKGRAR